MQITRALFSICFLSFTLMAQDGQWVLEKQHGKLSVFARPGNEGNYEVLAKTQISSSLASVLILFDDVEHGPEWIAHCRKVELLNKDNKKRLVHTFFDAPWPLRDRDMLTYSEAHQDPDTLTIKITVENISKQLPEEKELVRMQNVNGQWLISSIEPGLIEIRYQGSGDPAGNIPQWLANKLLIDSTYTTFQNMQRLLSQPQYKGKFLPDIKEPTLIP
jgi:hypothetical protein